MGLKSFFTDMTIWKFQSWERQYKERLSDNVFRFLEKDQNIIEYLSDWDWIWKNLKSQASNWQLLSDYSLLVLTICKIFEGVLYLLAREMGWFDKYNNGKRPDNIRSFLLNNRKNIEQEIDSNTNLPNEKRQEIKDKIFSIIYDFRERHKAVHYGSLLKIGEVDNYDAILTKIKELVSIFLENNLLS